jgi:sugar phosphate isomerase/epimerase
MNESTVGLRVGIDGRKYPGASQLSAVELIERCARDGHAGVFFRTLLDVSPSLDSGVIRDCRHTADDLGLYLEVGFGHINPFNSAEDNAIRACGDGDYLLGARKIIEAAASIKCRHLWASLASYQRSEWGVRAIDRFRTDVTWDEQLEYSSRTFERLGPFLRDNGATLAVETHEEVTSHELARMADRVGADIMSVTFDSANTVLRGEDPHAVARRLAPLVAKTHLRDITLMRHDGQIYRRIAPCGDGVIDWRAILTTLLAENPDLNLTIENATDHAWSALYTQNPVWRAGHPDLDEAELETLEGWSVGTPNERSLDTAVEMTADEQRLFVARSAQALKAAWNSHE